MTDAPPTTGLHHVTNSGTEMDETAGFYEAERGSAEADPFEQGHAERRR